MNKKIILISGLLLFGLDVSVVSAANRGGELNGSEFGGRKIVLAAKSVKEVMDVYDKMDLKNLIIDGAPGRRISGVVYHDCALFRHLNSFDYYSFGSRRIQFGASLQ